MATTVLNQLAKTLGSSIGDFATTTAQQAIQGTMGHNANLVSAQGQANAAEFNAGQANAATNQNITSMSNQYQFNAAQAAMANEFSSNMWQQTADWNEAMWERQAEFNAEQAEIQRNWQERMANTQYQRAIGDMSKAGLNPILAVTGGGVGTGIPGGATASVGGTSMSSAQGAMATGGLLGAEAGSVGGYQGQLEFTGGVLNLLANAIGGLGSSAQMFSQLGDFGEEVGETLTNEVFNEGEPAIKVVGDYLGDQFEIRKGSLADKVINGLKDVGNWVYNKVTGKKELHVTKQQFDNAQRTQQRMNNYYRFKGEIHG